MTERAKRRLPRLTLAGMMALVVVAALGLAEYRRRTEPIRRATALLKANSPTFDVSKLETRLALVSADGVFQQVEFTDRANQRKLIVTVPIRPGPADGAKP